MNKSIQKIILGIMAMNLSLVACEFTITNDSGYKVYIAFDPVLADEVSEQTLKSSSVTEDKIEKKAFAIVKNETRTTPFTKNFDVFFPLKSNGQYERRYRVHMKYCAPKKENSMTIKQIENTSVAKKDNKKSTTIKQAKNKTIDMARFDVIDFRVKHEAEKAHTLCKPHARGYEHKHEYEAQFENNTQLTTPGIQQLEPVVNPFGDKELLP